MSTVLISVVIPVKNGAATIQKCLEALLAQTVADRMEIIVVDSGSTDGTQELVKQFPVRLFQYPGTFNHGLTRNYGASLAQGAFVYLTVADSWQGGPTNLEKMLAYFDDPAVAGVGGTQATPPSPDSNPAQWYNPMDKPDMQRYHFPDRQAFDSLTPEQMAAACAWDDVNAMYRKIFMDQYPFPETDFAEDMAWAKVVLREGATLIRDSGVIVYHYHHRGFNYSFKVDFTCHYHAYRLFSLRPSYPPVGTNIAKAAYRLMKNHSIKWLDKFTWFFHNVGGETGRWYAVYTFRKAVRKKGGNALTEAYRYYCKTVPQGRLKAQN
jgi:rhamnosyltransferase